jgi:hypothetical protein
VSFAPAPRPVQVTQVHQFNAATMARHRGRRRLGSAIIKTANPHFNFAQKPCPQCRAGYSSVSLLQHLQSTHANHQQGTPSTIKPDVFKNELETQMTFCSGTPAAAAATPETATFNRQGERK